MTRAAPRTPNLGGIIVRALDAALQRTHTAIPGVVQSYDSGDQTADVQPAVRRPFLTEAGELAYETLPIAPSTPVVFPGSESGGLTFPVLQGDTGTLVVCSTAISTWLAGSGKVADAEDSRHHVLTDAVFFPGLSPYGENRPAADGATVLYGDEVRIGSESASDPVIRLSDLQALFGAWVPVALDGGAVLKTLALAPPGTTGSLLDSTLGAKVKVE